MYLPAALHVLPERMFRAISLWQVPADMRMHTALFVSPTPSPLYAAESATIPARQHATETTWMNPWVSATSSVLSQTRLSKTACLLWKRSANPNGKKIAVIGAGPSGLSCAYYLQLSGYSVEVFESESVAGGVLAYGIPEYRLPKAVLNRDIQAIEATGVQIHLNTTVGEDVSFDELYKKFHAVYVSTGTQLSRKANIPRARTCPACIMVLIFSRQSIWASLLRSARRSLSSAAATRPSTLPVLHADWAQKSPLFTADRETTCPARSGSCWRPSKRASVFWIWPHRLKWWARARFRASSACCMVPGVKDEKLRRSTTKTEEEFVVEVDNHYRGCQPVFRLPLHQQG